MVVGECARIWQVQSMRQAPRFVIARRPQADVAISGRHCRPVQAAEETYTPIASVAALTAQPLAALPPYGCGVPLAGSERLVEDHYKLYP